MKSRWNSLVVGGCNVIGLALLALSVAAGGSAVRAAGDSPVLDSVALEPLMKLADVFSQRIAKIEASVASFKDSLTAKRVAAQELCVADDSGAQTCITKAQLDTLLKGALQQTAQAAPASQTLVPQAAAPAVPAPAPEAPAVESHPACLEKCVAPDSAIAAAAPAETPSATESPVPAVTETAAAKDAVTVKETPAPEGAAAAVPPAAPLAADQHQATADAPAAAEVVILAPRPKPADTVVATVAQPDTVIAAEAPAAAESKTVPAEAPAAAERKE
jgi:hypothetical protein